MLKCRSCSKNISACHYKKIIRKNVKINMKVGVNKIKYRNTNINISNNIQILNNNKNSQ